MMERYQLNMNTSALFLLLLFTFLHSGKSIKCVSQMSRFAGLGNKTTCEGDQCVNYLDVANARIDKDCLSGFNFTQGCIWDAKQGILCFCNTDNCNSVKMKGNEGEETMTAYKCSIYSYTDEKPLQEESKRETMGVYCTVQARDVFIDGKKYSDVSAHSVDEYTTDCFPIPVKEYPGVTLTTILFVNGVYSIQYNDQAVYYYYKCKGDFCNTWSFDWVKPAKDVVTCTTDVDKETCKGEMCVIAVDSDKQWPRTSRFCITTNQTNAEKKFTVGAYKWKTSSFYFCKENNCNKDEKTVKKSIENYVKKQQTPPKLDAPNEEGENGGQNGVENSATREDTVTLVASVAILLSTFL